VHKSVTRPSLTPTSQADATAVEMRRAIELCRGRHDMIASALAHPNPAAARQAPSRRTLDASLADAYEDLRGDLKMVNPPSKVRAQATTSPPVHYRPTGLLQAVGRNSLGGTRVGSSHHLRNAGCVRGLLRVRRSAAMVVFT
jgi:hypothetical protein